MEGHLERMKPSQIFHSFLLCPVPSERGQGAFHTEILQVGGRDEDAVVQAQLGASWSWKCLIPQYIEEKDETLNAQKEHVFESPDPHRRSKTFLLPLLSLGPGIKALPCRNVVLLVIVM